MHANISPIEFGWLSHIIDVHALSMGEQKPESCFCWSNLTIRQREDGQDQMQDEDNDKVFEECKQDEPNEKVLEHCKKETLKGETLEEEVRPRAHIGAQKAADRDLAKRSRRGYGCARHPPCEYGW